MLEKKGVSPVQCQTATSGGNGGGGGPASGSATVNSSQQSVADNSNGLESNVLPQNRNSGSNATNLNSASMNNTNSGPNTPNDKMGALSATQDFVIIKSEDQKAVSTNHCDSKTKITAESNPIQSQLRNVTSSDSKLNMNTPNANMCGNRVAVNNNNNNINNNMKCRDNVMSCPTNGPLNGPLNGICANNTSLDILNDEKLSTLSNELGMPLPAGNVTMPGGDLPPLSLMPQTMNMMGPRGHCGPHAAQGTHPIGMNMSSNHMVHSHPHNNLHQIVSNNHMPSGSQKASAIMESQYMQQQSQIFVFNTQLANRAAEAVDSGQFSSIIDFHCSNPETKRLLEKYPIIKTQFNRTGSSAVWLNNLAQKQGGRGIKGNLAAGMHPSMLNNSFGQQPRGSLPVSCVGSCNMHNPSGLPSGPGPGGGVGNNWPNNQNMYSNNWSQQIFAQNSEMNSNQKFPNSPMGTAPRGCAPFNVNNNFQNNPQLFNNSCNSVLGGHQLLAGQEIPEENLTPQQRQHREKQLAKLRKLEQQFLPAESSSPIEQMMRIPAPNQSVDYMMDPTMCSNNMCSAPEGEHLPNSDPSITNIMTPSTMISSNNNNSNNAQQYSQSHTSMPPTSGIEWQKVQNNYIDERRRKSQTGGQGVHNNMCSVTNSVPISHQSPLSQPSSTLNSPSPCISQSPGSRIPPPPYNQGIRPHSSPHPSSPATGSLPLPSPRMQSPADASRQPFTPAGQSRLPHTSPGPATPSADSNSSISGTGVHSPKPLPSSNSNPLPSATSATAVQNSCNTLRTQASTNVTNNMSVSTPSIITPNSSPSSVKKLPNLMTPTPKGMSGQDCGELLINNNLSNSGQCDPNRKHHPNDMPLLGPTNCSSPFMCKSEPALMPVPSPQQIQYLNAFEGQELTIQKQPNTSLRDADLISPAPDLDIAFGNEFPNSCQPFHGNERLPNFQMMDNMNLRFSSNPQTGGMSGPQFDLSTRFMTPDNNSQRFVGPVFDGPTPRMSNSHENQFRPQNMLCMPFGQMDNNLMRFNTPCDNMMATRIRGSTDMGMNSRFGPHLNDNIQSPSHFNSSMSPMSAEQINLMSFPGSNQSSGPGCLSSVNNFNPQMESGISSTHLQNLQKMTPPFDIGPPTKVDQMMLPNGALPHSHNPNNQIMHGSNGSMVQVSQPQRTNNFDPMGESITTNPMNAQQNLMSGPSMNMSNMQVAANGPPPPNMVNFHTTMSSMQGMHQNISPDGNGMNGGMQGQYNMPQMSHNMTGGPQTVNNTYVNATMSIQQLNIQNVPPNSFNPNIEQNMSQNNMNIGPQTMTPTGAGMSPPSSAMQMMQPNSSAKLGSGFGHRMSVPTSGPNFTTGQQMNNPRVMSPMNYPPNPHMMQRCNAYNSPNIQVKPNAPNTIQYLPARPQNPNTVSRTPSLDFLQRFEPPLTNLDTKLPTHNLQYFPTNTANMNNSQGMPLQPRMVPQNMPMSSGPGRPMNTQMVRVTNPNAGIGSGQQPLMPTGDMFGRPSGPNAMMNGPHMGSNQPNPMFSNMKQPPGAGPMSPVGMPPDAAQPLPPSVGHSYNYKQNSFMPPLTSDPNYLIQYHNFQQQLYATNTNRTSSNSSNSNSGANNPRMPSNNFYNSSK